MKKKHTILYTVIFFIIFILVGKMVFFNRILNKENKQVLITIMNNIQIGDNKEKAEAVYNSYRTKALKLVKSEDNESWQGNEWGIMMPHEFGATDWI